MVNYTVVFLVQILKLQLSAIDNQKPTNWLGQARRRTTTIRPKPSEAAFSAVFSNFNKCRPKVIGDVISGLAVD